MCDQQRSLKREVSKKEHRKIRSKCITRTCYAKRSIDKVRSVRLLSGIRCFFSSTKQIVFGPRRQCIGIRSCSHRSLLGRGCRGWDLSREIGVESPMELRSQKQRSNSNGSSSSSSSSNITLQ